MVRELVGEDYYYPGDPDILRAMLRSALRSVAAPPGDAAVVVAPYAAYAHAIDYIVTSLSAASARHPTAVLILAPCHAPAPGRVMLPESEAFATPFGLLPVATELIETLVGAHPAFGVDEIAHLREHGVELMLPALHYLLGRTPIIPCLVGSLEPPEIPAIAAALRERLGEVRLLTVVAANLSGFAAPRLADARARKLIRLVMSAPGDLVAQHLPTIEDPPRSLWPLALGHACAGATVRPRILSRGAYDTEFDGDTGSVEFASIAYGAT